MNNTSDNDAVVMTGARQTMASWARVLESLDAVPPAYQATCAALFGNSPVPPTLILTPASRELSRRVSEKLLCLLDDDLTVMERDGNRINTQQHTLSALRDVEVGTILLYSWITINGKLPDGKLGTTTFTFNTATLRHFAPLLEKARGGVAKPGDVKLRREQAKLDYLNTLDFKFMNFAKSSLVSDSVVHYSLWQPEIRAKTVSLFGWALHRTIATAHLIVLTDKEFILIRDDARIKSVRGFRHGGVWRDIPRRSCVAAEVTESTGDLLTFTLHLTDNSRLDMLFTPDQRPALAELQELLP